MRNFVIGFILGLSIVLSFSALAFRTTPPPKVKLNDENSIRKLNDFLMEVWEITNGRYSPDTGSSASTGTGTVKMGSVNNANSAGWFKFHKSDGTVVYVPYWSNDKP